MNDRVTIGPGASLNDIVIAQCVGFVALLDKSFELLGKADGGDEYAVLPVDDARQLREFLAGIAGAMVRSKTEGRDVSRPV